MTTGDIDLPLPADLDHWAFGFMLVLARIAGAMTLLPGLGEAASPTMLRAGLALCVSTLLLPVLLPALPLPPEASLTAAFMIIAEVVTGVWFGWLARLLMLALPVAGQFIAYMMGIANVLQSGADLGSQTTVLARLFEVAAPMLIMVSGLYTLPLTALEGLYRLIPAGTLVPSGDGSETAIRLAAETFALALRLASPFVLASLVWQVATGLIARFLPRLQIYVAAVPGQILGGLLLLASLSGALLSAWLDAARGGLSVLPGNG